MEYKNLQSCCAHNIHDYIQYKAQLQQIFLDYLDDDDSSDDLLKQEIDEIINCNRNNDLLEFLHLIAIISNNHHRSPSFFEKIEKILLLCKKHIKTNFEESTIFHIFKDCKKILLFLFNEEFISMNKLFSSKIIDKQFEKMSYYSYFYQEIKPFIMTKFMEDIKEYEINQENYDKNRKIGENESYICQLIREDLVIDFIAYVNKTNYPIDSKIKDSIYETNHFLNYHTPTLIEYAAFFGSFQIMKYLQLNDAELKPEIWMYAIHGNNPDIIHFLESLGIKPKDNDYTKCYFEALKCHHNNIANYLYDNYLIKEKEEENDEELYDQYKYIYNYHNKFSHIYYKYFNFTFLTEDEEENSLAFYESCKYDYPSFLNVLIQQKKDDFDINSYFIITKKQKRKIKDIFFTGDISYNYNYKKICNTLLFVAIQKENLEIIKILLSNQEIDVNVSFSEQFWSHKDTEDHEKHNINWWKNNEINHLKEQFEYIKVDTPLSLSIKNENLEITNLLLEHPKINVNIKSIKKEWHFKHSEETKEEEETPLMISIKKKNFEIMNLLLLNQNIDINSKSIYKTGSKEFIYKTGSKESFIEIYYLFDTIQPCFQQKEEFVIKEIESTALSYSIDQNMIETAKLLLSQSKIDVYCKMKEKKISFTYRKYSKNQVFLHNWIFDKKENNYSESKYIKNVFYLPVIRGNYQIVQLLLLNATVDARTNIIYKKYKDIREQSLLHISAKRGDIHMLNLLLSNSNININAKSMDLENLDDLEKQTILHIAVKNNDEDMVRLILSQPNVDVNVFSSSNNTALHLIAEYKNSFETYELDCQALGILKLLVNHPLIDVNVKKISVTPQNKHIKENLFICQAPIHAIVNNNNDKFLRVLLSHPNIDINSKYICKKQNGHDNGFEKSKIESGTALHMAFCNHNSKIIKCLLHCQKTDINQKFQIIYQKNKVSLENEYCFLPHVFGFGHVFVPQKKTDEHLDKSSYTNIYSSLDKNENILQITGMTVLHLAIKENDMDTINLLLKNRNLDINETMSIKFKNGAKSGITALHMAIETDNFHVANLLLKNDEIDINALMIINHEKMQYQVTPLHLASMTRNTKIFHKLYLAGGHKNRGL